MTRRHFEMIARVVRAHANATHTENAPAHTKLAERFANELTLENERFDRARFLAACGVR